MKNNKILSALLALVMLIGMIPVSASAATKNPSKNMNFVNVEAGIPVLTFPMEYLRVSQPAKVGSHKFTDAFDIAGRDSGADAFYAPVDLIIRRVYHAKSDLCNALFLESAQPCLLATGTVRKVTILLIHVSNADLNKYKGKEGKTVKAGSLVCRESSHGLSTGNHLHCEISDQPYSGWYEVKPDVWKLRNSIPSDQAFWVDKRVTTVLKENGYQFKEYIDAEMKDTALLMEVAKKSSALVYPQAGCKAERSYQKGDLVFVTETAVNRDTGETYYAVDGAWIKSSNVRTREAESGAILLANKTLSDGSYTITNKANGKKLQWSGSSIKLTTGSKNAVFKMKELDSGWTVFKANGKLLNAAADAPSTGCAVNLYKDVADSSQAFLIQKAALFGTKANCYYLRLAYDPSLCLALNSSGKVVVETFSGASDQLWQLKKA